MTVIELSILAGSAFLLGIIALWKRKSPAQLRHLPALACLSHLLGLSVEDGTRLHVSLGNGSLLNPHGASALAGLAMLRHITERTSVSDKPPLASTGDPLFGILAQDTLQAGYQAVAANELYSHTTGRITGLSPFGYAAGAMNISQDEDVSGTILIGHFGSEAALLADSSERANIAMIGASDNLVGQAVLFANSQDVLIGEDLFSAGAYLGAGVSHLASLTLQDILRWLIILVLLGGAAAKFIGII